MLLTIIPFLLAARFVHDENYEERYRWRYGGESIYDISVNVSRPEFTEDGRSSILCSTITGELECRPKDTESLGCRFRYGMIASSRANDVLGCQQPSNIITRDHFFDHEPFDIRFHSRGIENLVVRRTISRWRLDVVKAVVAQLDIGTELDNESSWFVATENSTFGSCELKSRVLTTSDQETDFETEFEIVSLGSNESRSASVLARDGSIIIEKVRSDDKCSDRPIYFFGYASKDDRTERGTFLDMVSSVTRTTISKKSFVSRTLSEGSIVAPNGSTIGYSRQSVTLTLRSVNPAASVPPKIPDPASTSIHAPSTFDRYFGSAWHVLRIALQRRRRQQQQQQQWQLRTST